MNDPVLEDGEDLYNPTAVMTQDPVIACVTRKQTTEIQKMSNEDPPNNHMLLFAAILGSYVYLRFLR